jgi:solute carrier family 25 (adenine nucleotide translocator) protein 4/5/6/31
MASSAAGEPCGPALGTHEVFAVALVAAGIAKTCTAPVERMKLVVTWEHLMVKNGSLPPRPLTASHGIIELAGRYSRAKGATALWNGNLHNVLGYAPGAALTFACADAGKKALHPVAAAPTGGGGAAWCVASMAAGGLAGAASLLVTYSRDHARTLLARDAAQGKQKGRQFDGLFDVYRKTVAAGGVRALYSGFAVSCAGVVIYRGAYFGLYDSLRPLLPAHNLVTHLALGWAATVAAGLLSYPVDTVRRRRMMNSGAGGASSIHCAAQIVREEGARSLMRGAGANVGRGVVGGCLLATVDSMTMAASSGRRPRVRINAEPH